MRTPRSVRTLEDFGRIRLSESFFMRDFLYSDIATIHRMVNLPDDPELAIAAGRRLCEYLLEPLQATFGRLAIRSAYRSAEVNAFGNDRYKSCGSNETNRGLHIWDQRSKEGGMGPWHQSSFRGCSIAPSKASLGRRWRGGFTITSPTVSSSSIRSF